MPQGLLDTNKMLDFFSQFNTLKYAKGEAILRAGDTSQGVYFIKKGYVKLSSISKEGKELTLVIYKAGDFFPVVWTFFGGNRGSVYSFEALTHAEVLRSPREVFIDFVTTRPDIFLEVTKGIITRFRSSLQRMEFLTFGNASAKLASILLIFAKDLGVYRNGGTEIPIPLTHKDIASLVGVTRETVSLELKRFDRKGLIAYNKKLIIIKDKESLEKKAII